MFFLKLQQGTFTFSLILVSPGWTFVFLSSSSPPTVRLFSSSFSTQQKNILYVLFDPDKSESDPATDIKNICFNYSESANLLTDGLVCWSGSDRRITVKCRLFQNQWKVSGRMFKCTGLCIDDTDIHLMYMMYPDDSSRFKMYQHVRLLYFCIRRWRTVFFSRHATELKAPLDATSTCFSLLKVSNSVVH